MNKKDYLRKFLDSISVITELPQEAIDCAINLCDVSILQFQLISVDPDEFPVWALSLCVDEKVYDEPMAILLDRCGFVNRSKAVSNASGGDHRATLRGYVVFMRSNADGKLDKAFGDLSVH